MVGHRSLPHLSSAMKDPRAAEPSALTRIRQATAEPHRQLEALVESLGMLDSRDGVAKHLKLLYQQCAEHHSRLAAHPELQQLVAERRDELLADLQRLRRPPGKAPAPIEPAYSLAQCLGFTYVIEGSRLGALSVAKRLSDRGIEIDGLTSLNWAPVDVRSRWASFCERLTALPADEWDLAAATAVSTFRSLQQAHLHAS